MELNRHEIVVRHRRGEDDAVERLQAGAVQGELEAGQLAGDRRREGLAEELGLVDSLADEVRIGAGRDLAKQGELGREFVLITDGTAAVIRDEVEIGNLGPGDYFGELALLDDQPRNATVRAVSDLTAQVLDRRAFQTLLDDSPHMTRNLLSATAMRLAECDEEIARLRKRLAESVDSD